MTLGMFVFGLGQSPLSGPSQYPSLPIILAEFLPPVAQETIIVRFFKSHGLGVSLGPYYSTQLAACSSSTHSFQLSDLSLEKLPPSSRRAHRTLCHSGLRTRHFTPPLPPQASHSLSTSSTSPSQNGSSGKPEPSLRTQSFVRKRRDDLLLACPRLKPFSRWRTKGGSKSKRCSSLAMSFGRTSDCNFVAGTKR
jgi:hypothetical protein